jgi:hypothetical protein
MVRDPTVPTLNYVARRMSCSAVRRNTGRRAGEGWAGGKQGAQRARVIIDHDTPYLQYHIFCYNIITAGLLTQNFRKAQISPKLDRNALTLCR